MLIGFIGKKRVGKDTSADFLIDYAKANNIEFVRMALADPIKEIARIMFNFTEDQLFGPEKDEIDPNWGIKPRDFFEQFGTEIMQFDIYKYLPQLEKRIPKREFWVQSLLAKVSNTNNTIITDVRGNHEAEKIVERGGILIRIIKPEINTEKKTDHITQIEPDQIRDEYIRYTIVNDGTLLDLKEKIEKIADELLYNQNRN